MLTAKCLSDAPTPVDWTPRIQAAAIRDDRNGSSEKYSKFRPHSALRLMLAPGPSSTLTPSVRASVPSATPTSSSSSTSHVAASADAVGKHVAGTDSGE